MNRMSKDTNTQNSAPHRILNSPRFVSKMKHMNQISKDANEKWIKWHKWVKVPTNKLRRHKTYFKFITICRQNTSNDSNEQKYQRTKYGATQRLLNFSWFGTFCRFKWAKNANVQNLVQHYLLNLSRSVHKMNQKTQMTQISENINARNLAPHRIFNSAWFGISWQFSVFKVAWLWGIQVVWNSILVVLRGVNYGRG